MVRSKVGRLPMRPDQLETLHALGSRRLVAWSRSSPKIRRKLGFLKDDEDDFEDSIDVGEDADERAWVPPREVSIGWRRSEEGHMAYQLWMVMSVTGLEPEERDTRGP